MSAERDTIAAPASPSGTGAVAVVRLSGPRVRDAVRMVLGRSSLEPRRMTLCTARDSCGTILDTLLACFFPGPNSYTGEDVLELFPHGNPLLVRDIMLALRAVPGVRLAQPGEFTRCAFENGRLDLVQAEAVGALLRATEEAGLRNAERLLGGALSRPVGELAAHVLELAALMELEVDFAEEEADADLTGWAERLDAVQGRIAALSARLRGEALRTSVPSLAFYGPPNAGKSSLINALLGEDRLLVSAQPGTTRDWVEVRLLLPGGEARVLDTAGLGLQAVDELDSRAQERSRTEIARADLAVLVLDGSHWDAHAQELWRGAVDFGRPVVLAKSDLPRSACPGSADVFAVSAQEGQGLDAVLQTLSDRLFAPPPEGEDFWLGSARQGEELERALEAVERCRDLLSAGHSPELLAFEMQEARRHLRAIIGDLTPETVLRHIFAGFCIGK